jgi:hypothetical protein
MKKENILTLGILTIVGAFGFYFFKKNKLQVVNNVQIEKKIDEAVKEIASINKIVEEKRIDEINEQQEIKTELDNKEASDYIGKTLLLDKLNQLNNLHKLTYTKINIQDRSDLYNKAGASMKIPILTQIRDVQNTLKIKYGIYPDNKGNYNI